MTENAAYTAEYLAIAASLDGDIAGRRAAHAYMKGSTVIEIGRASCRERV